MTCLSDPRLLDRTSLRRYHVTPAGFAAAERFRAEDAARAAAKAQAPAPVSAAQRIALRVAARSGGVCTGGTYLNGRAVVVHGRTLRALVARGLLRYTLDRVLDYSILTPEGYEWVRRDKAHRVR